MPSQPFIILQAIAEAGTIVENVLKRTFENELSVLKVTLRDDDKPLHSNHKFPTRTRISIYAIRKCKTFEIVTPEDGILFAVTPIYLDNTHNGMFGTGFFYSKNDKVYLITCRHVFLNDDEEFRPGPWLYHLHESENHRIVKHFEINTKEFIAPKDSNVDLVAFPVSRQALASYQVSFFTEKDLFETQKDKYLIRSLESIQLYGFPDGLRDADNWFPIVRTGYTASHPLYSTNNRASRVTNIACYGCDSGGPVVLFQHNMHRTKDGICTGDRPLMLLGIHSRGRETGENQLLDEGEDSIPIPMPLGLYEQSKELLEIEEWEPWSPPLPQARQE